MFVTYKYRMIAYSVKSPDCLSDRIMSVYGKLVGAGDRRSALRISRLSRRCGVRPACSAGGRRGCTSSPGNSRLASGRIALHRLLQFLGRPERDFLARGNLDGFAGRRIAHGARRSVAHRA